MTNAKAKFSTHSVSELKLIRTVSITESVKKRFVLVGESNASKLKIAEQITKNQPNTFNFKF